LVTNFFELLSNNALEIQLEALKCINWILASKNDTFIQQLLDLCIIINLKEYITSPIIELKEEVKINLNYI